MSGLLSVGLVVAGAASLEAQEENAFVTIWDGVYTAAQADRGKAAFDLTCSRCHNSNLTGSDRGPGLVGDEFLGNWVNGSLESLFIFIRDTMPMGGAATLDDASKVDVMAYILQTNGPPPGDADLPLDGPALDGIQVTRKGIWNGIYTDSQATQGQSAFDSSCARCHGSDLSGGETAPPLAGEDFIANWETGSLASLFAKIRDTMPADSPSALEPDVKLDALAYMLQRNDFPSGTTALAVRGGALDTIQILRKGAAPVVPNFALVQMVGCLEPGPGDRWVLARSSAPATTREPVVEPSELERVRERPLGEDSYTLVSALPFDPASHRGQKVAAKGLLYREPDDNRLNVTALQTLADSCSDGQ